MCLGLVKVWHRWAHSSMPEMIPLNPFLFFFLSQATQKVIQPDQKLLSRFQNCLGNREKEHTRKRATTRANVTVALDECLSPPGDSRALGCIILPSSNAGCPKLHELSNRTSLFGPSPWVTQKHHLSVTASGFLASQANKQSLPKAYRPVQWLRRAGFRLMPLLEGAVRSVPSRLSRLLLLLKF